MKKLILTGIALGSCWLASGAPISLSFSPSSTAVTMGQSVTFALLISGHTPGSAPSVGAFDLTIGFDQALLAPTNVAFDTFLGDPSLFEALVSSSISSGLVEVAEVSLLASTDLDVLQPASFPLATLTFTALGSGTARLTLTSGVVDDAFGNKLLSIPEPCTLWIVALTLIGLIARGRRSAPLH